MQAVGQKEARTATLSPLYDEWLARAEVIIEQARRHGRTPVKVEIDAELFAGWCAAQGLAHDSDTRAAFVEQSLGGARARSTNSTVSAGEIAAAD